jgi:hypothetical protein
MTDNPYTTQQWRRVLICEGLGLDILNFAQIDDLIFGGLSDKVLLLETLNGMVKSGDLYVARAGLWGNTNKGFTIAARKTNRFLPWRE